MEPLADPIGLRVTHFRFGVFNIIYCYVELIIMAVSFATKASSV